MVRQDPAQAQTHPVELETLTMATNLVRFEYLGAVQWGVAIGAGIVPLAGAYPTTRDLIEEGEADWRHARNQPATLARSPPRRGCCARAPITGST